MSAFVAGIIFLNCGFTAKLPKDVFINGIDVGGKTRESAVFTVRKSIEDNLKDKSLKITGNKKTYSFTYPEIGYKDNLRYLVKSVKKGGRYSADVKYYLNGISDITSAIVQSCSYSAQEPYAQFNTAGDPFTYFEGYDGIKADGNKLFEDITYSLDNGFIPVSLKYTAVKRTQSLESVKNKTKLLSSFSTSFDGGNVSRAHNIRLASKFINGLILKKDEVFSFNSVVGQRTAERGFKKAKIIEKGEFVEGTGGGVCQVSTTIYNAAVLSGCKILEFHPHSLAVSYVPPSRDAMVSGTYFDLKFQNTTGCDLYIRSAVSQNSISFTLYGKSDGASYSFSSKVVGVIGAPVETTEDETQVKEGKDGLESEGYLTVIRNGITLRTLLRRDKYQPVKRIELIQENADN